MGVLTTWDFVGADWTTPDPRDSRYWNCIAEAFKQKLEYARGVGIFGNSYVWTFSPWPGSYYQSTFLERLPYDNQGLYFSFPMASFDDVLHGDLRYTASRPRPGLVCAYNKPGTLHDHMVAYLTRTYDGPTPGTPFQSGDQIARSRTKTTINGVDYYAPVFYDDGTTIWKFETDLTRIDLGNYEQGLDTYTVEFSTDMMDRWTWEGLCIDELGLSGEDIATPVMTGDHITDFDKASRWLATRRMVLDKLTTCYVPEYIRTKAIYTGNTDIRFKGNYQCEQWQHYSGQNPYCFSCSEYECDGSTPMVYPDCFKDCGDSESTPITQGYLPYSLNGGYAVPYYIRIDSHQRWPCGGGGGGAFDWYYEGKQPQQPSGDGANVSARSWVDGSGQSACLYRAHAKHRLKKYEWNRQGYVDYSNGFPGGYVWTIDGVYTSTEFDFFEVAYDRNRDTTPESKNSLSLAGLEPPFDLTIETTESSFQGEWQCDIWMGMEYMEEYLTQNAYAECSSGWGTGASEPFYTDPMNNYNVLLDCKGYLQDFEDPGFTFVAP